MFFFLSSSFFFSFHIFVFLFLALFSQLDRGGRGGGIRGRRVGAREHTGAVTRVPDKLQTTTAKAIGSRHRFPDATGWHRSRVAMHGIWGQAREEREKKTSGEGQTDSMTMMKERRACGADKEPWPWHPCAHQTYAQGRRRQWPAANSAVSLVWRCSCHFETRTHPPARRAWRCLGSGGVRLFEAGVRGNAVHGVGGPRRALFWGETSQTTQTLVVS